MTVRQCCQSFRYKGSVFTELQNKRQLRTTTHGRLDSAVVKTDCLSAEWIRPSLRSLLTLVDEALVVPILIKWLYQDLYFWGELTWCFAINSLDRKLFPGLSFWIDAYVRLAYSHGVVAYCITRNAPILWPCVWMSLGLTVAFVGN